MSRKAAVWRDEDGPRPWFADVCDAANANPSEDIRYRCFMTGGRAASGRFPTHAEALAWALEQVGLAPGQQSRHADGTAIWELNTHPGATRPTEGEQA